MKYGNCWIWKAGKDRKGYGIFYVGPTAGKVQKAHVVAYESTKGPIPEGLLLDHLCSNKSCVNPDHLEAVTSRENSLRAVKAIAAINAKKTHCPEGHPLSGENLLISNNGHNGARRCKTCKNFLERARSRVKPRIRDRRKKPLTSQTSHHPAVEISGSRQTDTADHIPFSTLNP